MRHTWLLLALLLGQTTVPVVSSQEDRQLTLARRLFLEVETAARLPNLQLTERFLLVYRDVCPQLNAMFMAHTVFGRPEPASRDESPDQAAARIERAGGWPMLGEAGRRRCTDFMTTHRDIVEPLVRTDLRSGSPRDRRWALHVIGEIRAVSLLHDVIWALRDPDPVYVAQALRSLDDPRAIPPLIRRFSDQPTRFFETLRSLQRNRPAHALLLDQLRSKDATARWQAAYALAESRDEALLPIIPDLVADPAPEVRRQAGYIAVSFSETVYPRVRSSIMSLLSDTDIGVRADISAAMGSRKDRASAPTLLALVAEEEKLEPWRQSNVVQAIHSLTGGYFGLTPGTPSSPELRQKALRDFARWIEEH